jgi:hypothetical protein
MKKAIILLTLSTFLQFSLSTVAFANDCQEKADDCYERCDRNWGGETIVDGFGRVSCKAGCAIAETGCIIGSWFE